MGLKLTQKELAENLGVSRNYIYLVESGAKPFNDKLAKKLELYIASLQPKKAPEFGVVAESQQAYGAEDEIKRLKERVSNLEQIVLQFMSKKE